jgi:FtsP/CotA-like multicopper oxidase with cupredoxin domain
MGLPGIIRITRLNMQVSNKSFGEPNISNIFEGGLLGPMIIHGPSNAKYDIDLGPVFLTDYYHKDYFSIVQEVMAPLNAGGNPRPLSDNNLINGKMNFDCTTVAAGDTTPCNSNAGISKFKFTTGKTHRLRLINAGGMGLQRFSIDGHNMTVIANDFTPIVSFPSYKFLSRLPYMTQVPYTTNVVTLGVGQRSDVLVTANQGPATSTFWMRANISSLCSDANQPNALAAIYYNKADTTKAPTSEAWNVPDPGTCENDDLSLTVPFYSLTPTATPAVTKTMVINYFINSTNNFLWTLDNQVFRADYNSPVLQLASAGNFSYPAEWNVKNFGSNSTIRIVLNNPSPASHPMHLHGHNMFVLHQGTGNWDGVSITNPNNPQRRDVQMVPAGGHMVIQINADNPGVWPLHCHIVWHVSGGLYANILERPSDIASTDYQIPYILPETCTSWQAYSNKNVVNEIDSGE